MKKEKNATRLVSSALLGFDCRVVLVNGKRYVIDPPTIKKIAGAGYYLSDIADAENIKDFLDGQMEIRNAASALSWLIQENEDLTEELCNGTLKEITQALAEAYSLIDVADFMMLSTLAKNVVKLIAKPKP